MDVPDTTKPPIIAPYPKTTRELSLSTVGPAQNKMSRELRCLQRNHASYINKKILQESKDKAYQSEFAMIQAALNSVAVFDDGSDTPKNYKDVLKHKNQAGLGDQ
jgi:hypothetical protein